ncbi:unnamed protein product [Mycena citricolor]|uniref:Uncharacterized protein n=1 Tax=Mycena citricolor TaxID=2018698 RepID=A0AAD2K583_9AGAR|nr:unnamed protein product [Mycena citricolor]
MSPPTDVPSSPAMSATSSFEVLTHRSRSSTTSSSHTTGILLGGSDDEIIWGIDSTASSIASPLYDGDDDDFVVLSRPRSAVPPNANPPLQAPHEHETIEDLGCLSLGSAQSGSGAPDRLQCETRELGGRKADSKVHSASPTAPCTPLLASATTTSNPSKARRRRRRRTAKRSGSTSPDSSVQGLGSRSIVDDVSVMSETDIDTEGGMYDTAARYISGFLAGDPTSLCRLTFLQSLIIECGLASSTLPASLTSARALIKSHLFLNIGEYLHVREQGPTAIQSVMHKSRSALVRDLRKSRDTMPRKWVKDSGLQVLMVQCYR